MMQNGLRVNEFDFCVTEMTELKYHYEYARPAVAVDLIVIRCPDSAENELLLIRRGQDPFRGCWALPGGFVEENETLEQAAVRELQEETSVEVGMHCVSQFKAYSAVDRDPRTRVISVVFWAKIADHGQVEAGDDAAEAKWFRMGELPELAFDHPKIITEWRSSFAEPI